MAKEEKKDSKSRFGEILLEYGIITHDQLKKALRRQAQVGGHVGSILEEMCFLDEDSLLSFLSKQLNVPPISLFRTRIEPSVLNLVSFEKVKKFRVLPVKEAGGKVSLAMVNPNDISAIQDVEFAVGRRVEPIVTPSYQIDKAIAFFDKSGYGSDTFDGEQLRAGITPVEAVSVPDVYSLLRKVLDDKATDLHITVGVPPSLRIDNDIKRLPMSALTPDQVKEMCYGVLSEEQKEIFHRDNEIDFAVTLSDAGRFRVNVYKQRNSFTLAARLIVDEIPSLAELALPAWLSEFALKRQGFILITGPSGHGKTTTMSVLIDIINSRRRANIITIEDPIEYLHKHKKSNVNQREIGPDTTSFAVGLKHIFRQNPDVIVIGEMRDAESIAVALTAAETGHLVLSTMHTLNSTTAIDRIIDIFPGLQQHQVRMQFADSFLLVLSQRLIPKKGGQGRIVAVERLINTHRTRSFIRGNK
ncbi:MAG TPA: PilT/PilU family type 4a pilus ATPase, partial [Nitrospirae bacterium]|nr:PilT/PilU family type 4a pilus ATPase [Nitrospirota bacterium]